LLARLSLLPRKAIKREAINFVTTGLDPAVHAEMPDTKADRAGFRRAAWIAGSSPAMTKWNLVLATRVCARGMSVTAKASRETFQYFVRAMNRFALFAMTDGKERKGRKSTKEKQGKRNAERRVFRPSAHRRQICAVCANRLVVRQRVQRDALAFRRSTTALAAANERRSSAPATRFLGRTTQRRALPAPCRPSAASFSSQTGHRAGRAYLPEPPGSGGDEPPPAGTALAPPRGVSAQRPCKGARSGGFNARWRAKSTARANQLALMSRKSLAVLPCAVNFLAAI
jgi:hypothetical protein